MLVSLEPGGSTSFGAVKPLRGRLAPRGRENQAFLHQFRRRSVSDPERSKPAIRRCQPNRADRRAGLFSDSGAILRASWCGQSSALLRPDIFNPAVNPLYRDLLAH